MIRLFAGGNITSKNEGIRKEVGDIATNTEALNTKKADIRTKIDKVVTDVDKTKAIFDKYILGSLLKVLAANIDTIMKSRTFQSIAKSVLMTTTRITFESITKETNNPAQKTEWTHTIQSLGILKSDGKSLRISPENLEKIKTHMRTLDANTDTHIDNSKIGSETKLCTLLIKTYEDRIAIKTAFKTDQEGIINNATRLAAPVIKTLNSDDFSSPEKLLKKMVQGCKEAPLLRGHIQEMISDKENPLHKVIVSVAGEKAIHALNIATSPEGLTITDALISAGSVDIAKSFLEDPIGTLLHNKDLLMTTAGDAFDHFVTLLDNKSATDSILALSDGKLQQADIDLLKSILPLAKEVISEINATESPTESPSKTAQLLSKIAGHVATKCDLELANIQQSSPGQASLPVSDTLSQLTTVMDRSIAILTTLTVGLPETPEVHTNTDVPPDKEAVPEVQTWGGWVSNWGSSVASGASSIAQFGSNVAVQAVASTLGDNAGIYVESAIGNASEILSDTASYISETVSSTATTIGNIPSTIVAAAVNFGIDSAATTAAKKIDTALDKALTPTEKSKKESTEITLNKEKLTEFIAQSVSLLSHFVAENPAVLDTVGTAATTLLVTASDILQNPQLDPSERAKILAETLKETLGEIGQAIVDAGGETGTRVGHTLINAGALLGSDLVERSLAKSKVFTTESIYKGGQFGQLKIRHLVLDKVTNTLSSIDAPKVSLPKAEKSMTAPKKVATVLGAYSRTDLGSVGGVIGRVVNFVGIGAAKGGLDIASQIIQVKY